LLSLKKIETMAEKKRYTDEELQEFKDLINAKLEKAKKLGVKVINEQELIKMLE